MAGTDVTQAAAVLSGPAAWPSAAGEPVFAEPWEGRAFALAIDVVERSAIPWEVFRQHLIAAIAEDPARPYYQSWVVALERLVLTRTEIERDDLQRERAHAGSYRYLEEGVGDIEVFPFAIDDNALSRLLTSLGGQVSSGAQRLADRCHDIELYRTWTGGAVGGWGLRLFDRDELQLGNIALTERRWEAIRLEYI